MVEHRHISEKHEIHHSKDPRWDRDFLHQKAERADKGSDNGAEIGRNDKASDKASNKAADKAPEKAKTDVNSSNFLPKLEIENKAQSAKKPEHLKDLNDGAKGVRQGSNGDCYYESTLASVANSAKGRKAIENMIRENADGGYTVTFPGDKGNPVTLSKEELAKATTNPTQAKWANILEGGFLKYQEAQTGVKKETAYTLAELLLTGNNQSFSYQWKDEKSQLDPLRRRPDNNNEQQAQIDNAKLEDLLGNSTTDGRVITACSRPVPQGLGRKIENSDKTDEYYPESGKYHLPGRHGFTVMEYDRSTKMVTLRNPWGADSQGDGAGKGSLDRPGATVDGITNKGNGFVQMSLEAFKKHYYEITVSSIR